MVTTSLRMTNKPLSKLKKVVSCNDHKRTQQGVSNAANDKYAYSNIHVLSRSLPHHFHKVNMFSDVIVLDSSTTFQTYDFILYDTSYDCGHVSLYHPRKNQNKINRKQN